MSKPKKIELFVFYGGKGILFIYNEPGADPVQVDLSARFVRVIEVLQETLDDHISKGYPPDIRGWTAVDELADEYDSDGPEVKPENQTIVRYVCLIGKEIAKAIELELIECGKDHMGYRLTQSVIIIYVRRRPS